MTTIDYNFQSVNKDGSFNPFGHIAYAHFNIIDKQRAIFNWLIDNHNFKPEQATALTYAITGLIYGTYFQLPLRFYSSPDRSKLEILQLQIDMSRYLFTLFELDKLGSRTRTLDYLADLVEKAIQQINTYED